ncbi:UNVERIFIED_CONTAM: methyltransferase [Euhalothece sp. KZN 001]
MTLATDQAKYTQFGCGLCAPSEWLNFDASPSLRLQRLPIVGQLVPGGAFGKFPSNVLYGDIVKGLPIPEESVELLYCSHILEHLALNEFRQALKHSYRHLKSGGIFRFVLPDLECLTREYLNSDDPEACMKFMRLSCLGKEERKHDLKSFLRQWLGGSEHLWMWDYKAMSRELEQVGFTEIRRAKLGDSGIPAFDAVEDPDRWTYELGVQCRKP